MSKLRQIFYKAHNKEWLTEQLGRAAYWNKLEKVKDLIAVRAPLNETDALGYTPLLWAANMGHTEIVRCLVAAGAHLEVTTETGSTALDLAALNDRIKSARILLDAGAQITAFARMAASTEIKTLLEYTDAERKHTAEAAAHAALEAAESAQKKHEDWLDAGMPLTKPLKIVNKPLKLNKT